MYGGSALQLLFTPTIAPIVASRKLVRRMHHTGAGRLRDALPHVPSRGALKSDLASGLHVKMLSFCSLVEDSGAEPPDQANPQQRPLPTAAMGSTAPAHVHAADATLPLVVASVARDQVQLVMMVRKALGPRSLLDACRCGKTANGWVDNGEARSQKKKVGRPTRESIEADIQPHGIIQSAQT